MLRIDLSKQIALVTGATGQIGRIIVKTLARCGADVAIQYFTNQQKAEKLLTEVQSLGVRGTIVQADITNLDSVLAMRDNIVKSLGKPLIIVNTAVIQYQPWTQVLEQSAEDYESQFRSCVLQAVFMAKAFVPDMIKSNYGRIIAINTECSMENFPNQSAYVAGKRGMDGVLRVLAKEIGKYQITVNQIAPGWVITESVRLERSERQEAYESKIPLKRRGEDQDVANVVAFLASDLASYITGAFIPVCGGNIMPCI